MRLVIVITKSDIKITLLQLWHTRVLQNTVIFMVRFVNCC